MTIDTLFLDKGEVLIPSADLSPQWLRLIAEFYGPRLGRTAEQWAAANGYAFPRQIERWRAITDQSRGFESFHDEDDRLWLGDMLAHLHITVSEGELVRLAREGTSYIRRNLRLGFPDTVSAVRRLRQIGIRLNAASGDSSHDLAEYLGTMGIRDQFDRLYGTDLIDTAKASPAYYRAILADSRADSARSAVVDDSVRCLNWARECGLATYLMAPNGAESDHPVVRSLTELVDRLAP